VNRLSPETIRFVVLGGGTVIIAAVLAALELLGLAPAASSDQMARIGTFFAFAALFVNYPHALWSYRLAYGQGGDFVRRNRGTLVIFPVLLILGLSFVSLSWKRPVNTLPFIAYVESALNSVGVFLGLSSYQSVGALLLAFMLVAQMVFLGQHYAMQAYGVTLHCSRAREYPLDDGQKRLIRFSLVAIWAVNVLSGYTYLSVVNSSGFEYITPRFPDSLRWIAEGSFVFFFGAVLKNVVHKNWRTHRRLPPPSAWGAYLGLLLWLQPYWYFAYGYHLWVIQFGHCAQYLYFVVLVERSGFMGEKFRRSAFGVAAVTAAIFVLGYLGFEWIPTQLDRNIGYVIFPVSFFILSAGFFINFHHYFIDAIVWRNPQSIIRPLLQSAARKETSGHLGRA
jgi:hypothetical protein